MDYVCIRVNDLNLLKLQCLWKTPERLLAESSFPLSDTVSNGSRGESSLGRWLWRNPICCWCSGIQEDGGRSRVSPPLSADVTSGLSSRCVYRSDCIDAENKMFWWKCFGERHWRATRPLRRENIVTCWAAVAAAAHENDRPGENIPFQATPMCVAAVPSRTNQIIHPKKRSPLASSAPSPTWLPHQLSAAYFFLSLAVPPPPRIDSAASCLLSQTLIKRLITAAAAAQLPAPSHSLWQRWFIEISLMT